ncbi:MAG: NADPH-dependent FMN reductase, partial [Bdellovibrionales bacterium]
DLHKMDLTDCVGGEYYKGAKGTYREAVERVTAAEGVVFVVPEYNGSYPGALKLFIDYWKYPETFEYRPMAFVGLGGRWGGLRPVEHLQQVVGYRNAYVFPNRVFISNIKDVFRDGVIIDALVANLLQIQSQEFLRFVRGLKSEKLDANSRRAGSLK